MDGIGWAACASTGINGMAAKDRTEDLCRIAVASRHEFRLEMRGPDRRALRSECGAGQMICNHVLL